MSYRNPTACDHLLLWDEKVTELNKLVKSQEQDIINQKQDAMIILCGAGAVLIVLVVLFCIIYRRKAQPIAFPGMDGGSADHRAKTWKANEPQPVIPRVRANRLGVNEHPAVRDQFGMKEVFDVTPREGMNLVRIARPLETAGADRKLSEELLDIQPIFRAREGLQDAVPTDTMSRGTRNGNFEEIKAQKGNVRMKELLETLGI